MGAAKHAWGVTRPLSLGEEMSKQVGRRKRENWTRLAIRVKCGEETCEPCKMLEEIWDEGRKCMILSCIFFTVELMPAAKGKADRCSDCHMAERCARGHLMD